MLDQTPMHSNISYSTLSASVTFSTLHPEATLESHCWALQNHHFQVVEHSALRTQAPYAEERGVSKQDPQELAHR